MRALFVMFLCWLVVPTASAATLTYTAATGVLTVDVPVIITDTAGNPLIDQSITLPTPVNAAFSTATTGGTLAAGTYWYRVAATIGGRTTLASTETSQTTTGATSTVTVNWGAVAGATGYDIYCRATGAQLKCASVGAVTTWVDTGSVTPSGALPGTNTTHVVDIDYFCGSTNYTLNETGASMVQPDSVRQPGLYMVTPGANNPLGTNCAEPKLLTVSGGGTDRVVFWSQAFTMSNGTLDPGEIGGTVTGTVVSSADCTNSATTFDTTLPANYSGTNGPREAGIRFTSGALVNEVRRIGGYNTNGCVSANQAFSGTPAGGDAFVVVNQ